MLFSDASKYFAVLSPISAQNRSFLIIPENFLKKSPFILVLSPLTSNPSPLSRIAVHIESYSPVVRCKT